MNISSKLLLMSLLESERSADLGDKFMAAFVACLNSDSRISPEFLVTLGIPASRGFRPNQCYRLEQRNALLREVARYAPPGIKPHIYIAGEIHVFEDRIWPRWKTLEKPPENAGEVRSKLFMARKITPTKPLPGIRQIANILKSKKPTP